MNKKKVFLVAFWIGLIISFECIYRMTLFKKIIDRDFVQMIVFCLPVAILIYIFTTFFKEKTNKRISTIMVMILYVIFFAQMVYYQVYESVFSIYSMTNGGQVFEFWKTIVSTILDNLYNYVCLTLPVIFYLIFKNNLFDFNKNRFMIKSLSVFVCIFLFSTSFFYIANNKKPIYSSYNLFFNTHAPVLSAKKFGLLTTMARDLDRTIFGLNENKVEIVIDKPETKETSIKDTYNVIDIDFEKLKETEDDESVVTLHTYFNSLKGTKKNEYTGMFEGKNVIFFLAESLDPIAIDRDLTPTLYKLSNEGFDFKNYYSPLYPASTADGEFRTEWSLISSRGDTLTLYANRKVYSPYIFANSFADYNINVYHNYDGDYYKRKDYFKALGYENFKACNYGLNIACNTWHESDLDMVKATYEDYIDSETPFFAYYITLSGHLSYLKANNKAANNNWSLVENLPYSEKVKTFIAANIEVDKALKFLIQKLDENGKLDDTVIIVTPDHYPYGLSASNLNEVSQFNRDDNFELYHSDLIIWNNSMERKEINKVSSQPDVLPTMLNLFGKEYDSRLLIGKDLLSDSEGLVILSNRSWITDKVKYDAVTNNIIVKNDETIDDAYVVKYNNLVDNQFKVSNMILQSNYYKKVFNEE